MQPLFFNPWEIHLYKGEHVMAKDVTILIADPNLNVRQFLARELTGSGYHVVTAGNYKEIFRYITEGKPPDLIIFDLNMPHTNGFDALRRLNSLIPPIPTIIYSYLTEYEKHPEIRKAEAFVQKEDDPMMLFSAVDDVIRKHHAASPPPGRF
jgi:CheY-like chemotaxis protein